MHDRGAVLCSACSGIFLLAETGLFDGKDATVHFGYARAFAATYPAVPIHPERVLVISGLREELVSSGASTTWHDLVLYLIARYAGATTAQEVARLFALQWHQDGLTPYIVFEGKSDHGDAEIQSAQQWLSEHFSVANPVEEMIKRSRLAERTFKRRFTNATGLTPIAYVQRLRIEDAKRRLERTDASVDEISWRVGYEDAGLLPAPVQAHDRPGAGRLSQALSHPRLRSPVAPKSTIRRQTGHASAAAFARTFKRPIGKPSTTSRPREFTCTVDITRELPPSAPTSRPGGGTCTTSLRSRHSCGRRSSATPTGC